MSSRRSPDPVEPVCIECGALGVLTPTPATPKREAGYAYVCACGAKVGCHPGSTAPLGRPCGPATAMARDKAHRLLDRIWKAKVDRGARRAKAREDVYRWLGRELGLPREACHIGSMDLATCRRVIELCRLPPG